MKPKPRRVALTLPPEIDDILSEISKLTATPKTAIITDILNDAVPAFNQVIEALKQAQSGKKRLAIDAMAAFLSDASKNLNQFSFDLGEMRGKADEGNDKK